MTDCWLIPSPLFLSFQVLIIFDRHVLFHVELGEDLPDKDLITLKALRIVGHSLVLPHLVLVDLLVKVADRVGYVDSEVLRDLGQDTLGVGLKGLVVGGIRGR